MIYFIQQGIRGSIKIGYSKEDVEGRMADLQVGSPKELFLLGIMEGDLEDETNIHKMFEDFWIRGEWYTPDKKIRQFIFKKCDAEQELILKEIDPGGILIDEILQGIEINYIEKAMMLTNRNISKAAKLLGISFRSMRYRLDKYKYCQF